jgi:hypothetical protein
MTIVALDMPAIVRAGKVASGRSTPPTPVTAANDDRKSAIVTAKNPRRGRFGDVPDMTPEEHKRRGMQRTRSGASWCAACARNDAPTIRSPRLPGALATSTVFPSGFIA